MSNEKVSPDYVPPPPGDLPGDPVIESGGQKVIALFREQYIMSHAEFVTRARGASPTLSEKLNRLAQAADRKMIDTLKRLDWFINSR